MVEYLLKSDISVTFVRLIPRVYINIIYVSIVSHTGFSIYIVIKCMHQIAITNHKPGTSIKI